MSDQVTALRYVVDEHEAPVCDGGGTMYAVLDTTKPIEQSQVVWHPDGGHLYTRDAETARRWADELNERHAATQQNIADAEAVALHAAEADEDKRTCAFPGDQEHDHRVCEDALADDEAPAELVWCDTHNLPGAPLTAETAHRLTPECRAPHFSGHYPADDEAKRQARKLAGEQADGLRSLAAMIELNPHLAASLRFAVDSMSAYATTAAEMAAFVRAAISARAKVVKDYPDNENRHMSVTASFGPVAVRMHTERAVVCERVVTGRETVTKRVKDPDALAAVPEIEVTEEVEQVEWVCRPLLAAEAPFTEGGGQR